MASLTGNQVGASYLGIIKTLDNTAISASPKQLSDGAGNSLTVCASTTSLVFTGTADFSAATVVGISGTDTTYDLTSAQSGANVDVLLLGSDSSVDTITLVAGTNVTLTDTGNSITIDAAAGGAAGLVSGTGTDSMQSSSTLTTTPADAAGAGSIVLGEAAFACSTSVNGIALGTGAKNFADNSVVIGTNACNYDSGRICSVYIGPAAKGAQCSIGIGNAATTLSSNSISLGSSATVSANSSIGIGNAACILGLGTSSISIGCAATTNGADSISIGSANTTGTAACAVSIGWLSCACANGSIAIGQSAQVFDASRFDAIAIGRLARVAQCSIAIGADTDGVAVGNVVVGHGAQSASDRGIAVGMNSTSAAACAVALGFNVNASRAGYVTGCGFEACVAGQGIVVKSPDGLITLGIGIDNSGNIVTYTP